jgi:fatty acid desaturase
MFLHAEHHLFPAVPTAHLKRLAGRLDAAMPGQNRREVLRFGAVPVNSDLPIS